MKKFLVILLGLTMVFALSLFTACSPSPEDKPEEPIKVAYAVPTITAGENGITVTHDTATAFKIKEDNGEWADGTFVAFSETVGAHTVKAYAVGSGDKLDSEEATFSYETKATELTVEKGEGRSFTVEFTGVKLQESVDGGEYEDADATEYQDVAAGNYSFKATGGWVAASGIFYTGESVKSITAYAAPTITAGENGITVTHDTATAFKVKEDDGEWADGAFVAFNETVGTHTVKAYAVGGETAIDSEEATFSYETKTTELNITKGEGRSFTVEFAGVKLQKSVDGGEYENTDATEYQDVAAGNYSLKAVGGWVAESSVFYGEDVVKSIKLVGPATAEFVIEDAEEASTGSLQDTWDIKKYDQTWQSTTASISLGEAYDGSPCAVFECWNNTVKFRYGKTYTADAGYNAIAFDVKGDGIAKMELSVKDSNSGIYINAPMGTIESGWTHYEISLYDSAWKINYNGAAYNVDVALETMGASVGVTSKDEVIAFCDTFSIILYGSTSNGASTKIPFDNIVFKYAQEPQTQITKLEVEPADVYLDFGTYTKNMDYNDAGWTQFIGTDTTSGQMRIRQGDKATTNAVVNMYTDTNVRRYAYGMGGVLGKAKYFSVRLGNYFSGRDIGYKIVLVDISDNETYLAGGKGENYEVFSPAGGNTDYTTRTFVKKEFEFEETDVKYLYFEVKAGGGAYLYIDDLKLNDTDTAADIDLSKYSSVAEYQDFEGYSGSFPMMNPAGNVSSSRTLYVRNDGGYDSSAKYASAQYSSNGTAVNATTTISYVLNEQGIADSFSFAIANNRNGNAKNTAVTVKVYDVNNKVVDLNESADFTIAAGTDWTFKTFTFERTAVKKVELVLSIQTAGTGDAFMKLDDLTFGDSI